MANIINNPGNSIITGTASADTVFSLLPEAGNDTISTLGGNDVIFADAGNDVIDGGLGNDRIDGGANTDTALFSSWNSLSSQPLSSLSSVITLGEGSAAGQAVLTRTSFSTFPFTVTKTVVETDTLVSIENVTGSAFADTIIGNTGINALSGAGGNDTLRGGRGSDRLDGGDGTDTADYQDWNGLSSTLLSKLTSAITLGDGAEAGTAVLTRTTFVPPGGLQSITLETDTLLNIENVSGSAFSDTITGNAKANVLDGGAGNDTIAGGAGDDTLKGGDGIDTADYSGPSVLFNTQSVNASLAAGEATVTHTARVGFSFVTTTETDTLAGFENLTGSDGNDRLTGDGGANTLSGNAGGDVLQGLGGADRLDGGDGLDTADYSASAAAVAVDLAAGSAAGGDAAGDVLVSIENVSGSALGDTLTGSAAANVIRGNGGDDVIEGGAGADTLDGGAGVNTLSYEHGPDVTVSLGGLFAAAGAAAGDVFTNFANLTGSATGNDRLGGDAGGNILKGLGGDDSLEGGAGADTLDGGTGFDTADYRSGAGIVIDLAKGETGGAAAGDQFVSIERFIGGQTDNVMKGDGNNNVFEAFTGDNLMLGRAGNDRLFGGSGADTVKGGGGADTIFGNGDADRLFGNAGTDDLHGGDGADAIDGGAGNDELFGGSGGDTFVFKGRLTGQDTVADFEDGADRLEFHSRAVDSFADFAIAGNGTAEVTLVFDGQSITLHAASAITLTADDFSIF